MRRLALGFALLLIVAPAASARSFEMASGAGDFVFVALEEWETQLSVGRIVPPATVTGPRELARSVKCLDKRPLHTCFKVRPAKGRDDRVTWTVRRAARIMHVADGAFAVEIRDATRLVNVFLSGCGTLTLDGRGAFTADGTAGAYSPSGPPTLVALEP